MNENKKLDKYLDFARDLRKLKNTGVTVIPIFIGSLEKRAERVGGLEEGESRPSLLQHCWDRLEYWEESWRLEETCYQLDFCERSLSNAGVKKLA